MNHQPFLFTCGKSTSRRTVARLRVTAFATVALLFAGAGFCADALKARQAIEKPNRTGVDRTLHHTDRIYVKFRDDSNVRLRGGQLTDLGARSLAPAGPMLGRLANSRVSWRRQHSVSEERLSELRETGQRNTGKTLPDLNTAYILHLPAGLDPATVIDDLNALEVVEIALPFPLPAPPPVVPNYEPQQGYLNPAAATNGVNAKYAWTVPGGNGANVKIVDIEYAWNLNHGDLLASLIGPAPVVPAVEMTAGAGHHGTAVLGVMGGRSDGVGVTGIAWGSTFYVAAVLTANGYDVAAAITTAMASTLRPGDIIVIEQQTDGPAAGIDDWVPAEWFKPTYDAIVTAVANDVIVCEAAGNGNQNLDDPIFNVGHKPFLPENDSGAIIVGAGAAAGPTNRSRLDFSSYGSAVDLQGWGESVVTTGYGTLWFADGTNALYTSIFNGTSSATPIVAGACAAVQGAYRSAHGGGQVIGAIEMRALLQATGSPQTGANENIGPLPNLAFAIPLALVNRRIWVDFAYTGEIEAGTPAHPVKTLPLAITAVSANGAIIIKGGSTPWRGTITKPLSLHAYLGEVTIGQ